MEAKLTDDGGAILLLSEEELNWFIHLHGNMNTHDAHKLAHDTAGPPRGCEKVVEDKEFNYKLYCYLSKLSEERWDIRNGETTP